MTQGTPTVRPFVGLSLIALLAMAVAGVLFGTKTTGAYPMGAPQGEQGPEATKLPPPTTPSPSPSPSREGSSRTVQEEPETPLAAMGNPGRHLSQMRSIMHERHGSKLIDELVGSVPPHWDPAAAEARAEAMKVVVDGECGCNDEIGKVDCSSFPCVFYMVGAAEQHDVESQDNWTPWLCLDACDALGPQKGSRYPLGFRHEDTFISVVRAPLKSEEHAWLEGTAEAAGMTPQQLEGVLVSERFATFWTEVWTAD